MIGFTPSKSLKPGMRVHTLTHDGSVHRALGTGLTDIREVRYAYPAGNVGKARTFVEFTDDTSGEFPTNVNWIVESV